MTGTFRPSEAELARRIAWPPPATRSRVRAAGLTWHLQLRDAGSRDGPSPLALLLHGTGASSHSWSAVAGPLAGTHRLLAPDLPGHGLTAAPSPDVRIDSGEMARRVAGLLEVLDERPELVVGHSAGAAVGVRLLAGATGAAPLAFVGVAPALGGPRSARAEGPSTDSWTGKAIRAAFRTPAAARVAALASRWGATERILDSVTARPIPPESRRAYRSLASRSGPAGAALRMMADWDPAALRKGLAEVAQPTLLLAGERDPWFPPAAVEASAACFPSATSAAVAGVGHLPHEEAPGEVSERIGSFWRSVTTPPPPCGDGPPPRGRS